jgi:CxxC motif-containing protein
MSERRQFVCIGCPVGCPLQLEHRDAEILEIAGNECDRGAKYARQEFTDPRRSLSTTIAIAGARWARLPVRTTRPVPKDRAIEAARLIHAVRATAPVRLGDVLLRGLLGEEGLDVVATRSMPRE